MSAPDHPGKPSAARALGQVALMLVAIAGVGVIRFRDRPDEAPPSPPRQVPEPTAQLGSPRVELPPIDPPTIRLPIDDSAVSAAGDQADAAARDRGRAEFRRARASADLRAEAIRSASAALARKALPETTRDPTARLARASAKGNVVRAELESLRKEGASLANAPKPKGQSLIDPTPVSRPADGDEFHFEIRRDRVAFIDLEKLMDRVRTDVRIRLRVAGPGIRRLGGTVGPVGAFSLEYEMGRQGDILGDTLDMRGASYGLTGWEVVPESNLRGETFETALMPSSEFSRAINRLRPGHATITIWVYPDSFELFRKLRNHLHSKGFAVAARPLPDGIPIRGSPGGTASASQ
ncbi:MAG: hypothetical protein U0800_23350 [Isosphaeraceae bacterium]